MSPAIQVRELTKVYGSGRLAVPVLRGIDMTVPGGEVLMLAGPSGSGKTTLLSLIGCVLSPTSGSIELFGEEVGKLPESRLPRLRLTYVGFVFQGHNLISSLTATQNIAVQLQLRGWRWRDAVKEADSLLDQVGLGDRADHRPSELSGGQRQRVAVARAVAGAPPIILADEPTASLDAQTGLMVTDLLARLARDRGHTVVIVTHDQRIFHFADRVIHLEDGEIAGRIAA